MVGISGSELGIGEGTGWSRSSFDYKGKNKEAYEYFVDPDFIGLMGMQIIAGRNFDPRIASDTQNEISNKYGVFGLKSFMGKEYYGITRSTFLIDISGRVVKIYDKVKAKGHSKEVLEFLESAQ